MKKRNGFIAILALTIAVSACGNKETKTEEASLPAKVETSTSTPATVEQKRKTEISVGENGAEVKTKSGTEVKVSDKGTTVGTKDVNIKIGTKKDN